MLFSTERRRKQNVHNTKILGTGEAFPEHRLTNADIEKMVETSDQWIVERTGIRERRTTQTGESTADLGSAAARMACENAGCDPKELDLILCATITPDEPVSSTAAIIAEKLQHTQVKTFDLTAACSGFVYGLSFADQFIRLGSHKRVLVVGSEVLSTRMDYEDRTTCILFGDGAGAALVGPTPEQENSALYSSTVNAEGKLKDLLFLEASGSKTPISSESVAKGQHHVVMKGKEIFKAAVRTLSDGASRACEKAGISIDELDWFIPHQANLRIMEAVAKRMGIDMAKVLVNVDRFGNTSSATVPTALHQGVVEGKVKRGDLVLLDAFGAGLTYGTALLRY
jgi:3-oxoacyl-[acyl-carrier-protein] synthase-3